jgi:flagellar biosynthesis chaperone FliJ
MNSLARRQDLSAKKVRAFNLPLEQTCRKDWVRPRISKRWFEVMKEKQRAERCDQNN